uniref:NADH-ubiquinone oxidoreductase chain 5 n=1 Tax=Bipes tridactylus TaxID=273520 RepID=Q66SR0_9SAUR|nr:NADH dehydrogenase subunit 5 [Bipes tridactylus]AAT08552.1 NADH dehydrogenase subunit 5 [Bipes tridactylus]
MLDLFILFAAVPLILFLPLVKSAMGQTPSPAFIAKTVKLAFITSLMPPVHMLNLGVNQMTWSFTWFTTSNLPLHINLLMDPYTMMFTPTALFITWSIMEFSQWYMAHDPYNAKFSKYLLVFLLAMLALTTTNNLIQLFVGWEAVGLMSFLLISWWFARQEANTSAMQAVAYNRIGDIGLLMAMAMLATPLSTFDLQEIFSHTPMNMLPLLLGLILAAAGKSAQFMMHPWLPAAMEGPTPVSALLHSSTMVVAGVFMLLRTHPLMENNQFALTTCLCLGSITSLFASVCSLAQNDIKKIIAFSTTSQLGLMMVTIGLNLPKLAFLHLLTHAFFKSLLFLCSGAIIHNLAGEQDIRKMGALHKTLPTTSSCMTIATLALMGTPFMSGFFSKDAIIEAMATSWLNVWALTITALATILTAAYSARMLYYTQLTHTQHTPLVPLDESNPHMIRPITRLALATIISGAMLIVLNLDTTPQTLTMPTQMKLLALTLALLGLTATIHLTLTPRPPVQNSTTLKFSSHLAYYNTYAHRNMTNWLLTAGQKIASHLNDQTWLEHLAPKMLEHVNTASSKHLSTAHQGRMKSYLSLFLLTMFILLF